VYLARIGELEPGQIVARAVMNAGGAVLCPPGLELTQATIQRLENAGVGTVAIEGENVSVERLQQRIDALRSRFSQVTDPLLVELGNAMEGRLQAMLSESRT